MAFIEIQNADKGFGPLANRVNILQNINLEVERGEFVAIIGFSGSGKTTLMSLLAGLSKPDHGEVRIDGQIVSGPGSDRGVVFQNYSLLPWLTVYENVALAVDQVFPEWTVEARRLHTERHIAMVNLSVAVHKLPRELSGGMRQRVSVARALATKPEILLLDEPLSALDALTRANLQDEINRICQEDQKTVILITNDPDEAILLADRVIPLTAGPRATLGPSIPITIPRPRIRTEIGRHREYQRIRNEVIEYLLKSNSQTREASVKRLILPDLLPENLDEPRRRFGPNARPRRRSELKVEVVETVQ